jgi:hypothetical protein
MEKRIEGIATMLKVWIFMKINVWQNNFGQRL